MLVTSPPFVPAKTISGCSATDLLDDAGYVLRLHAQAMPVVHRHDGRPAAAAEALDGAERERAVPRRRACAHSELLLESLDHPLRPCERARDVRAHLHDRAPDRLEAELVVERCDRRAVRGRELEC